ncbi:integrase core domain-containing protein [Sphingomonas oryzagri]
MRPPAPQSHGRALDAQPKDATGIKSRERRSRGRSAAVLYNTERPHSSLGYATPAAFAAELEKQRAGLTQPVASPALMRDNNGRSLVAAG